MDVYITRATALCLVWEVGDLHPPNEPGACTVQMIVDNLWQLAPPEAPTPQEEAEEARRQQALKVCLPCASSCFRVSLFGE